MNENKNRCISFVNALCPLLFVYSCHCLFMIVYLMRHILKFNMNGNIKEELLQDVIFLMQFQ